MTTPADPQYVSRGGIKLAAALEAFKLDVAGFICADFGANVGGFTDCLLQRGAAKVYAIDTGYGQLAWKLRNDPRVVVMERTNALHLAPSSLTSDIPHPTSDIDLVVIDLGWTRQQHAVPAALKWKPAHIVTLIKPHYESDQAKQQRGILGESQAAQVLQQVLQQMPSLGVQAVNHIRSPIFGGAGKGKQGNVEFLAHLKPKI